MSQVEIKHSLEIGQRKFGPPDAEVCAPLVLELYYDGSKQGYVVWKQELKMENLFVKQRLLFVSDLAIASNEDVEEAFVQLQDWGVRQESASYRRGELVFGSNRVSWLLPETPKVVELLNLLRQ